jgi:hypothetical protein
MKTALCLSGHIRSYKSAYKIMFDKIIQPLNCDIFIHTWDTEGFDVVRGDQHLMDTNVDENELKDFYQAKDVAVEKMKIFDTDKYQGRLGPGTRNKNTVISMFDGIKQSNDLKSSYEISNNIKYDITIRARPDLLINHFDCQFLNDNKNGIYFPKAGNYHGLNDQFAFGKSEYIDFYSDFYSNLDHFFNLGCPWHPESIVKFGMVQNKIPILRSNIKYGILRANGDIFYNAQERRFGDEF